MPKISKKYSIAQARNHPSEIVHQAEAGEKITLTRRGKPVAALLAQREFDRLRGEAPGFLALYQDFREKAKLTRIAIDKETFTDLRDKSSGRDIP